MPKIPVPTGRSKPKYNQVPHAVLSRAPSMIQRSVVEFKINNYPLKVRSDIHKGGGVKVFLHGASCPSQRQAPRAKQLILTGQNSLRHM
jgi:hypothetical protein